jgi:hypothetical protein
MGMRALLPSCYHAAVRPRNATALAKLANTAMPLGGGGDTAGLYVIEALVPGAPLASLRAGPRGAGPDMDLYGLGQTIAFALTGQADGTLPAGVPTAARRVIDAARALDLADRCRWSDLVAALRD